MNAELKQEWINRLLSDDYHQGLNGMRTVYNGTVYNDAWGILLDILVEHKIVITDRRWSDWYWFSDMWFSKYPSYDLMEAIGIPYNCGPSADIRNYLANLNDTGSNFIYIAGEIEEYVPAE